MSKERLPMRKIREVLRLRWVQRRSVREVSRALGVSTGIVSGTVTRAKVRGLSWELVEQHSDEELEQLLYGPRMSAREERPKPDPLYLHMELKKPGVTLELLHLEYLERHPTGYRYTAFCDVYRRWHGRQGLVMRQQHKAGEKLFTDFSGKKPWIIDPTTGARVEVELFVAVLGASNFTHAEATATTRVEDWVGANVHALEFIDGVPEMTVPDQHKAAVTESSPYEPGVQKTFAELGRHYAMAVVPARPGKARDKAKVEVGVQVAQRWILARLRNERFFSLEALNERIRELRDDLNNRPMKKYGGLSRRELFERVERPALRPLPADRFEPGEWSSARVEGDYHANVGGHFYSMPWVLAFEEIEARATATTIELFHKNRRVAAHPRSDVVGGHTTDPAHRHPKHRWWAEKDPERLCSWAASVGPQAEAMTRAILSSNFHREQAWKSAWGLRELCDKYGPERLERACERSLRCGGRSYRNVERILKLRFDEQPIPGDEQQERAPIQHGNVRGGEYYIN